MSSRFVAAMTTMSSVVPKPSSSTRSWFSVCSRSSWLFGPPRDLPIASNSSKKMTPRPSLRAWANSSRIRLAPTPTYFSTNSEPDAWWNGTPASAATARASIVLPVPGGPYSMIPRGIRAPSLWKRSGRPQELDRLGQLELRLVAAGDVGQADGRRRRVGGLGRGRRTVGGGGRRHDRPERGGVARGRVGATRQSHDQQDRDADHQQRQDDRPRVRAARATAAVMRRGLRSSAAGRSRGPSAHRRLRRASPTGRRGRPGRMPSGRGAAGRPGRSSWWSTGAAVMASTSPASMCCWSSTSDQRAAERERRVAVRRRDRLRGPGSTDEQPGCAEDRHEERSVRRPRPAWVAGGRQRWRAHLRVGGCGTGAEDRASSDEPTETDGDVTGVTEASPGCWLILDPISITRIGDLGPASSDRPRRINGLPTPSLGRDRRVPEDTRDPRLAGVATRIGAGRALVSGRRAVGRSLWR